MECPECGFDNAVGTVACVKCTTPLPTSDATMTRGSAQGWSAPTRPTSASSVVRSTSILEPGNVLGNRYEVLQLLGEGGMGAVYKVRDREVDRFVALKVIRPELAENPEILQRFKQELILARQVTHKNVIRIFDLGEADGIKFITMDFVDGQDLRTLLRQRGKFAPDESISIISQVCRALDAAHSEGVIHRDLKPQNIMLDGQGRVRVMDFGIARSIEMPGMTQTGALVGTPEYMSPEQAKDEELDARSDLFTLGIILYELLTGKTPYSAKTALATMLKRTQERARPPIELDPAIPAQLNDVVMKCLEIDRDKRYSGAREILRDLGQETQPLTRASVVAATAPTAVVAPPSYKKWAAVGAAIVVLASVAFVLRGKISTGGRRAGTGERVSLAILPFRNASADPSLNWLGGSLAEMLRSDVGQSSDFHTVPPDRLHQILSDLRISPDSELDPSTLRRIAEFTNANRVVWGQYVKLGDQIRIDANLQDLKQQRTVSLKAEAPDEKQLLGTVDQLAKSIQENLILAPEAVKEMQASAFTPSSKSPDALRDYSQGLELWRQGNQLEAAKKFEAATKEDPNFALAFSMLGQTYQTLGYDKQADQFSTKAVDLSGDLPPAEKYMIQAANARIVNNYDKAVEAYDNLAKLLPDDPQVQFELGALNEDHGALDQAQEHYAKVVQSDPKYIEALLAVGRVEVKRSNPQAALDYLNRALSLAVELNNQQAKANVLHTLGSAYRVLNRPDDALRNDQESLAIKKQLGDKRGMAASLDEIAQIHILVGKPEDAAKDYQDVLKLEKEVGNQAGVGLTLMNLGDLYFAQGKFDEALNSTKQALQIQLQMGDENLQAISLNNIGTFYFQKGQYDDALTYLQRALDLRQKLKVQTDIAQTLNNIGEAYRMLGQYDKALDSYLRALEISRNTGDKRQIGAISDSMATLFELQGRYGAALNAQQDALTNFQQLQQQSADLAMVEADYGQALTLIGRGDEAQKSLDDALKLARSLQNDPVVATVLNFEGDRFFYSGDFKSARPLYEQALQAATRAKDPEQTLLTKFNLARLSVKEGRGAATVSTMRGLAKEADTKGLKHLSAQCSIYLGEALVDGKDYPRAQQELESALRKSQDLGLKSLLPQAHYLLATALRGGGKHTEATTHLQQAAQLLEDMHKESHSDALPKRIDLKPIAEEAAHKPS